MSEPCTQKVYAYWRECDHLTLDLGGSCPVCADIETRVTAARLEALERIKETCMKAIETTINQYRCQFTMDADVDNMHLPLVDKLCPPNAVDITEGKEEIELLIDAVRGEVLQLIEATDGN